MIRCYWCFKRRGEHDGYRSVGSKYRLTVHSIYNPVNNFTPAYLENLNYPFNVLAQLSDAEKPVKPSKYRSVSPKTEWRGTETLNEDQRKWSKHWPAALLFLLLQSVKQRPAPPTKPLPPDPPNQVLSPLPVVCRVTVGAVCLCRDQVILFWTWTAAAPPAGRRSDVTIIS